MILKWIWKVIYKLLIIEGKQKNKGINTSYKVRKNPIEINLGSVSGPSTGLTEHESPKLIQNTYYYHRAYTTYGGSIPSSPGKVRDS